MIKELSKNKVRETVVILLLVALIAICFIAAYLEENMLPKYYDNSSESLGPYRAYMPYKIGEFPNGYIIENHEDGVKVISSNGDIVYETYKDVKFCNRKGYIYEIDEYGRYSIINLETGENEKTLPKNEIVKGYIAGFWIIGVEVKNENGVVSGYGSYYYLLDESYQVGADGIIFNTIEYNNNLLDDEDDYIYGARDFNYTMYNRYGIEERSHDGGAVIISNGKILYITNENSRVTRVKDNIAQIYFYNDELERVYVSLKGPDKGQFVKVDENE